MAESPLEKLRRLKAEEDRERSGASRRSSADSGRGSLRRGGLGAILVAAIIFLVTKGKLVLLFLATKGKLLLGLLKLGPLLTTLSTMAISAWVYAGYYGARLAVGIVVLILVHELGHGAAAKAMRLKVGAPVFIPFFGAVIALKEQPRSAWIEAVVGFGGPFFGLLGGLVVLGAAVATASEDLAGFLYVLAWFSFLINMFNLMPVFGLDGARISRPFRPWYWLPGSFVVVLLITSGVAGESRLNPILLIILILGIGRAVTTWWKARRGAAARAVDRIKDLEAGHGEEPVASWHRVASALAYFLLLAALAVLTDISATHRPTL